MATQLLIANKKSKPNWKRMLNAANKLEFEDGKLLAGKGWKIDDMDVKTISEKLKNLEIDYTIKDNYTIIIN